MTREGYTAIQKEIEQLWTVERPKTVDEVAEAASLGDRSENAAYIYGKKKLREIDSRLRYLRQKLEGVVVVDLGEQVGSSRVQFGAIVELLDDDEEARVYRLVDKEESEPRRGWISVQSPLGQALLGKTAGDYVRVTLPKGVMGYEIVSVRYGADGPEKGRA